MKSTSCPIDKMKMKELRMLAKKRGIEAIYLKRNSFKYISIFFKLGKSPVIELKEIAITFITIIIIFKYFI